MFVAYHLLCVCMCVCVCVCVGRGMLYKDLVSLWLLIQVFRGRPFVLQPLNLVLYAC